MTEKIRLGIVGVVGRGGNFLKSLENCGFELAALCDINAEGLEKSSQEFKVKDIYTDYIKMLDNAKPDAVIIGTPMPLHAEMAIAALERNIHVMSEVTAAVSVEECKKLVRAAKNSKAIYMMAENYCYSETTATLRHLAVNGYFGEIYFAEGEYIHDCTYLADGRTPWRRHWQMGIDGVTYCTHSLGPVLQWLNGDRVARVCCEAAGKHRRDKNGDYFHRHSPVMLCKTEREALIKIRMDLTSEVPHNMTKYRLQGTDGAFEDGKIWFRDLDKTVRWHDFREMVTLEATAAKYLAPEWLEHRREAERTGHGGGDYFVMRDFARSIREEIPCPIGIHEAMDMSLPGLLSQQSIKEDGRWLEVPDSRKW
ncbi:MAG: Gfo/Idh/MocA family oxidoreductase [Victivallales bacterium]|nr:Gfo/Idh/MocA family oxidoreductase [Victivallales bacterium]